MLARGIEWQIKKHDNDVAYPLTRIGDTLATPDLTIGNFEGTIREHSVQEINEFSFDTTREITATLADAGIDVLSLSNNHSNNYGSTIVRHTRTTITELGMTPFGDPHDSASFIAHRTVGTITFAFLGFHAFEEDPKSLLSAITAEHAAGNFVIVFPHWGNEYQFTPSVAQTDAAHQFVDAGADAIIGSHPHVIQTHELYHNVPIVYSLGNFIFDQDWSVPTQQGLMLDMTISDTKIVLTFIPVSVVHSRVSVMDANEADAILAQRGLPKTLTIPRQEIQIE
jgi:poly-gamma-glutamate synthesis protein (capsule biosynthesis protein)